MFGGIPPRTVFSVADLCVFVLAIAPSRCAASVLASEWTECLPRRVAHPFRLVEAVQTVGGPSLRFCKGGYDAADSPCCRSRLPFAKKARTAPTLVRVARLDQTPNKHSNRRSPIFPVAPHSQKSAKMILRMPY